MEPANTIGLDIAKSVFQLHGVDATGDVVVQRRLSRGKILRFRHASSGWRRVERRTTGAESSGSLAMMPD